MHCAFNAGGVFTQTLARGRGLRGKLRNDFNELTISVLLGMGAIAALSLATYVRLPRMAFEFAQMHSRYSGLGMASELAAPTNGKPSIRSIGSLQGEAA